jgi:hypothetical protein
VKRAAIAVVLSSLAWLAVSGMLARANGLAAADAPAVVGPVNCATFAPPVVAYDVYKDQLPRDAQSFLDDLVLDGFSTGTISRPIPACVDVLIVRGLSGTVGMASPYSVAEAAALKTWVDGGHGLIVSSDWGSYRMGVDAIFAAFGHGQGGPGAVTDPDDFDPIGGNDWVIYQADNFAPHPILGGITSVELLRGAWLSATASAIITSDANSNPPRVPVMAAFTSGAGCAVLVTDSDWMANALPLSRAGYFKRDNALLARQSVGWLNGCGRGPIARPGGPYVVYEGSSVTLDGSASSDPGGDPLTFAWDLDNDGAFDDATIVNPVFSAALRDDGVYTVSLRVSDGAFTDTGLSSVTVLNVAPSVWLTATATSATVGTPITFTGSFTDPGVLDTHTMAWNFGDGSPPVAGLLVRTRVYTLAGGRAVTLTVTDDDGGAGQASVMVLVTAPGVPSRVYLPLIMKNVCVSPFNYADIAVVMDTSGSMNEPTGSGGPTKLQAAKSAATEFLNLLVFPGDQAAIVSFDTDAVLEHILSDDRLGLIAALDSLVPAGVTRMDLGLAVARAELASSRHVSAHGRVIVFLTDGLPNGTTEDAVLAEAAAAKAEGITIFTIGLGPDVYADLLRAMATSSSHYYFSPSTAELNEIYRRIVDALRCTP